MKKLFDQGIQIFRDTASRAKFGVTEAEERETREHGLEQLGKWSLSMYAAFSERFDPHNREATEGVYQAAKRAETLVMDTMNEMVYGSSPLGFGDIHSALGAPKHPQAAETRARVAEFAEARVAQLETMVANVTSVLVPKEDAIGQVIPLKGGPKPGFGPNDFPDTRQYLDELGALEERVRRVLEPMKGVQGIAAVMRLDDTEAMSSLLKTIQLDLMLWKGAAVDFHSKDLRRYNYGILQDLKKLTALDLGIGRVVHEHERAFSKDGYSSHDRGLAYMMGRRVDSFEADMGQGPQPIETPKDFTDPLGYCTQLGLSIEDFSGKTQDEIRKMLKTTFYPLAAKLHPDNRPATEKIAADREFSAVGVAYEILSDQAKRQSYFSGQTRGL